MKLLVTGATGFTGSYTIPCLLGAGHTLRCLYRPSSDRSVLHDQPVEWIPGDLSDEESLMSAMQDCQGLINIASLGFGHGETILRAATAVGIKRAIFISTTAIFTSLSAASKVVRLQAEESIRNSLLQYTILRPTMIYGSRRDRNISRLIKLIQRSPIIPVAGNGTFKQQPVYVGDVAAAICAVVGNSTTYYQSYNIAGRDAIAYNQMVDTIAALSKKRVIKIHLPAGSLVQTLSWLEKMGIRLPIKAEQVLRLNEDKIFDNAPASTAFGFDPRSFSEGILIELEKMKVHKA